MFGMPVNWTSERMSLKVDINLKLPFTDHVRKIGKAIVILHVDSDLSGRARDITLKHYKCVYYEEYEGEKPTEEDLLDACTPLVMAVWDDD